MTDLRLAEEAAEAVVAKHLAQHLTRLARYHAGAELQTGKTGAVNKQTVAVVLLQADAAQTACGAATNNQGMGLKGKHNY